MLYQYTAYTSIGARCYALHVRCACRHIMNNMHVGYTQRRARRSYRLLLARLARALARWSGLLGSGCPCLLLLRRVSSQAVY